VKILAKDVTLKERMAVVETEARHAKEVAMAMTGTCKATHEKLDTTIKGFSEQLDLQGDELKELSDAVAKIQHTLDNGLTNKIVAAVKSMITAKEVAKEQTNIQKLTAFAPYVVAIISSIALVWVAYIDKLL